MDHFCRCFCLRCCLRCWHSNTNYTRNITPTYKTHYYPTWGGILADVCSALLFPLTHLPLHTPRRHHWPTLLHCLSLTNTGGLFSPFSLPVSTSHCPWHLLYIHFPMQRVQWKRLVSHRRASQSIPRGESLTSTKLRHHHSLCTLQAWKWPSTGNTARSSLVWYVNG